ncbi:hypothetical protein ACFL2G_03155 [Candidatus Omnitrophota bacterium]
MGLLKSIHAEFKHCIEEARDCTNSAHEYSNQNDVNKNFIYNIYEISFLKVFTGWEAFLENSFIAYMSGATSKKSKPRLYLKKINKDHALKILCGTLEYPDWTKIEEVRTLAKLYFIKGGPFLLPLKEIEVYYNEMKKIRNAIAHISENAKEKFYSLVKAKLPVFRQDICPGELLCNRISSRQRKIFFEHYINFLEIAANKIMRT